VLSQERKTYMLSILQKDGSIVAKDVSQDLNLSEDTIRRDLRALARQGLLKRVHGGAVPVAAANASFSDREHIATPEKTEIGARAARMIQPGSTVFVDGGTTAVQLARHLPADLNATVVTHSLNVALQLLTHDQIVVEIVGGRLMRHSVVTTGAATIAWLNRYRPDQCFIGMTGIHPDQGITTGDGEDAEVKRAIIARSGSAILLASSEKFGAVASFEIAPWSQIDGVVVARDMAQKALATFSDLGCTIHSTDP